MNQSLPEPNEFISQQKIASRIKELGKTLSDDYQNKHLSVVAISNGAIPFVADLIRAISIPLQLDTIAVHSYIGTESSGQLNVRSELKLDLTGRHVLLLDDILDTGRTLSRVIDFLKTYSPETIKTCVLLDKPDRRIVEITPDYSCFTIPDHFVVGYGLDYNEYYRNLPYIGILDELLI